MSYSFLYFAVRHIAHGNETSDFIFLIWEFYYINKYSLQLSKSSTCLIFQRYVPFAAVAAANCVNIPFMRQNEVVYGIDCTDDNGNIVGQSKIAAAKGITQVVISRIVMCAPGMLLLPIFMERAEKTKFMQRITYLHGPIQVFGVGCLWVKFSTV